MRNSLITLILLGTMTAASAAEPNAPASAPAAPPAPAAAAEPAAPAATAPASEPPKDVPQLPSAPPPPSLQDNPPPANAAEGSAPGSAAMPPPGAAPAAPPPAQGQWVNTNQYGWIWMPYARNYTYVDNAGELAFTYAYYPTFGWRWLAAPWVLGWGPAPFWGRWGTGYYAWYAHPWFHRGVYRPVVWEHYGHYYGRPVGVAPHPVYAAPRGRGWRGGGGFRHR